MLLTCSRGIVGSRPIEAACRQGVQLMAVAGDSPPHFTTIAAFVSEPGEQAKKLFARVVPARDRAGLIGREMFAIGGVKLASRRGGRSPCRRAAGRSPEPARFVLAPIV